MTDDVGTLAPAMDAPAPAPDHVPSGDQMPAAPPIDKAPARQSLADTLRKADQTVTKQAQADQPDQRTRDEQGRFTAREPSPDVPRPDQKAQATDKPLVPDAPKPPAIDAPTRFSADAKAAWATTPDPVKSEISRAFKEMEAGLAQYQQRMEPLKPYYEIAQREGTTVEAALQNYVRIAEGLQKDPAGTLNEMFRYANVDPRQWAAHVMGQPAPAVDQAQQQYQQHINALNARIAELEQSVTGVNDYVSKQQEQQIMGEIQSFAKDHPRFDELRPHIVNLLEKEVVPDLATAYQWADRLNPAPVPAVPPAPQPQTPRRPSPQISGAPSPGSNPAQRPQSRSIRESLEAAAARAG